MLDLRYESTEEAIAECQRLLNDRDNETGAALRFVVEYAEREGGLTLKFWELKRGPLFGKPTRSTIPSCARELDVPVSDLTEIWTRTWEWVEVRMKDWRPGS